VSHSDSGDTAEANWPRSQPPAGRLELKHVVEARDGCPNYCTLCPRETSERPNLTEWLSATGSAFVDAAEMR
jgi:hypothetical protein